MAKGNLFLGYGRGKVGDVVFSRQNGEQVTRARNRAPRNPQSALQMLQRVVMKTSATAYSMLRPLCDHSFQGRAEGTPNQSRFAELNVAAMRNQLRLEINSGEPEDILTCQETNFAAKADSMPQIRPYVIAEGTIPPITPSFDALKPEIAILGVDPADQYTYDQMCALLGVQRGDQLTFVALGCDDRTGSESSTFNSMTYARIIMEPANGDMSTVFLDANGFVNSPNAKNNGTIQFTLAADKIKFILDPGPVTVKNNAHSLAAIAIIVSRETGGVWQRSNTSLVIPDAASFQVDHEIGTLQDAIYSYLTAANSTLYLNQAE